MPHSRQQMALEAQRGQLGKVVVRRALEHSLRYSGTKVQVRYMGRYTLFEGTEQMVPQGTEWF